MIDIGRAHLVTFFARERAQIACKCKAAAAPRRKVSWGTRTCVSCDGRVIALGGSLVGKLLIRDNG